MHHAFVTYLIEHDLVPPNVSKLLAGRSCLTREPIGMIAVSHGLLQAREIDLILDRQRECKEQRFGEIAVSMGFLSSAQVETLIKIQEFRVAGAVVEALALAGVLSYEDAVRYVGAYFAADEEILSIIANK
jgi:hypothetical protein